MRKGRDLQDIVSWVLWISNFDKSDTDLPHWISFLEIPDKEDGMSSLEAVYTVHISSQICQYCQSIVISRSGSINITPQILYVGA